MTRFDLALTLRFESELWHAPGAWQSIARESFPMLTSNSAPLVVKLRGPLLSRAAIDEVARQIAADAGANAVALILECHEVSALEPSGLRALFELAERYPDRKRLISAAPRVLLRAALQTDMAERFDFWASTELAKRHLAEDR